MKAILFRKHGGLEQVYFGEVKDPRPGPGQVLVRTRAAALNHLDLFVLGGLPGIHLEMPHVPGADGAGEVLRVGEGVASLKEGQRVMLNACLWCGQCEFCRQGEESLCVQLGLVGEHVHGTFAEYFVVPEANLEVIPDGIDFQEAAAFALVFQTAWRMLVTQARLQPGEDVFIHGIGGGVASAALEIVKLIGGRPFVSSSSEEKLDAARRAGAVFCCNYLTADPVLAVLEATGKRGVDVVVDTTGANTWLQSLKIVRKGGRIITCGATTGANPQTEIRLIFWKQLRIHGSTMSNRREFSRLVKLLGERKLRPRIDRVFPLSEGAEALRFLSQGKHNGKIVLSVQ